MKLSHVIFKLPSLKVLKKIYSEYLTLHCAVTAIANAAGFVHFRIDAYTRLYIWMYEFRYIFVSSNIKLAKFIWNLKMSFDLLCLRACQVKTPRPWQWRQVFEIVRTILRILWLFPFWYFPFQSSVKDLVWTFFDNCCKVTATKLLYPNLAVKWNTFAFWLPAAISNISIIRFDVSCLVLLCEIIREAKACDKCFKNIKFCG